MTEQTAECPHQLVRYRDGVGTVCDSCGKIISLMPPPGTGPSLAALMQQAQGTPSEEAIKEAAAKFRPKPVEKPATTPTRHEHIGPFVLSPGAFDYQPADEAQLASIATLRQSFAATAKAIAEVCPDGPDRTYALRHLRETFMWCTTTVVKAPDGSAR